METKINISDKDTDIVNTKNCKYCNKPFTDEELWCKECINTLENLAKSGNANLMFHLAICYRNGKRTGNNLEKSFYWFHKAAENNIKEAIFGLAICYENGEGTEKNLEKAFHWYQKAAEKDHIKAIINLAVCYEDGKGTEKNLEKALHLYQKAAKKGDIIASASTRIWINPD
ncbi:uncharacterized protein OCT59_011731 [Rhizophagus irregularis]|uniref:uncharacterized protein n=1 Tax=Rhizophagus irregularis TaxID=588596 RepID=UPI000CB1BE84|nr:hypothetical protein OCT59_011731 [Rhizophagus irregularis]GBC39362.1 kinase-like domain-containing protein [Rhizophagus irregularis DAOM 181602=DAOM 197198]